VRVAASLIFAIVLSLTAPAAGASTFCDAKTPLPAAPVVWPKLERVGEPEPEPSPKAWTWVNLWASWCAPCTHEIPRLLAWRENLPVETRLLFLNVEEDAATVGTFLKKFPQLRGTWWVAPGDARAALLRALGVPADAFLPVQVLVDPERRVRCVHVGALEESDRAAVDQWFSRAARTASGPR
jgi:thiol-disulfide isomerase/thioredoxin